MSHWFYNSEEWYPRSLLFVFIYCFIQQVYALGIDIHQLIPGRLQSMGSLRVRDDWATSAFNFHFHALEKEMATHSSVLAWRIPGTGKPGGLPSMGSHRVRHDWSDLAAAAAYTRSSRGIWNLHFFGAFQLYPTLVPGDDRDGWRHIRGRRCPWTYPARSVRIENWICHLRHALSNNYRCHGDALKRMTKSDCICVLEDQMCGSQPLGRDNGKGRKC